ncbi:hypothetical protein FW781_04245 (plasmid) [Chryseobacterium panacisoli]|uniref:Uncharacterized protein n=1 Tax=Chryseobacterium panacisoli TaxID=1807141 RepID=A0A5D9A0G7_9FLAO|nr:hypothetical protein [Chryseobacterium panacisoli]TZF99144.1 hypothetical protein FW781_04245 [Chryseobacterium panacisoli]
MTAKILIFLFSGLFLFSYGQKKKKKHVDLLAEYHSFKDGELRKDFSPTPLNKRIAAFPFSKATKVKIISYNLNLKRSTANSYVTPPPPSKTKEDSIRLAKYYDSIKKNTKFELREAIEQSIFAGIQESRTLTLSEISELTDVIYNTCDKYYFKSVSSSGCFFPRNAILFYDEDDKIFAYFEICFECSGIESSPRNILDPFKTCEYLYPDLQKFFKSKGLTTEYEEKK